MRALEWGGGDALLASCGGDGAVYQWKLKNFKRAQEHVLKARCGTPPASLLGSPLFVPLLAHPTEKLPVAA